MDASSARSPPFSASSTPKTAHTTPRSACPLLQALHRGLWPDDTTVDEDGSSSISCCRRNRTSSTRTRNSVRDYWERHEKKIPCAPVMELVASLHHQDGAAVRIDREQLHLTSVNLLHNYLLPIKKAFTVTTARSTTNKNNSATDPAAAAAVAADSNPSRMESSTASQSQSTSTSSTLEFMDRILVCIRFVQLVLEYREPVEPDDYCPSATNANTTPVIQILSMHNDADIQELVLRWIRSLTGTVCSILEIADNSNNDESAGVTCTNNNNNKHVYARDCSHGLHRHCVAAVTLGELLKLQHHYAPTRPFVLAPLGKAVCTVAVALSSTSVVPRPMLHFALHSWGQLLRAGLGQTTHGNDHNPLGWTPLTMKIFGFLVQRLTIVWNLLAVQARPTYASFQEENDHSLENHPHLDAVRALVQLQHCTNRPKEDDHHQLLKPLRTKMEKCWTATTAALSPQMLVQALLELDNSRFNQEIPLPWVLQFLEEYGRGGEDPDSRNGPIRGKDDDWGSVLWLVEHALFRGLPRAVGCCCSTTTTDSTTTLLFERALHTLSKTLWRCERHWGGRLHHWLVHWLSVASSTTVAAHPLSRELVLELLTRHAVQLEQQPQIQPCSSHNRSSEPLVRLCVRLIFDVRTVSHLRASLVALVALEPYGWRTHPGLMKRVHAVVRSEYAALEATLRRRRRRQCSGTSRRRKRRKHPRQDSPRGTAFLHRPSDLIWILQLLSSIPIGGVDNGGLFPPELVSSGNTQWSPGQVHLAALLTVVQGHGSNNDSNKYQSLASDVMGAWQNRRPSMNRGQLSLWIVLSVAVLRRAHRTITFHPNNHISDQELTETTRLVTVCLNEVSTSSSGSPKYNLDNLHTPLVLEAIRVLGVLGHAITPQTSSAPLQNTTHCFQTLLAPQQPWIVHAHTLTALQHVASRLPSGHQNLMVQCLPKAMTPWFRARLQGTVVRPTTTNLPALERQHRTALVQRLPLLERRRHPILPGRHRTAVVVAPGSYVLQMPTQEGRHALVIFPPGKQSMEDIRYMLGKDENEEEEDMNSDRDNDEDSNSDGPRLSIVQNGSMLRGGGIQLKLILSTQNAKIKK